MRERVHQRAERNERQLPPQRGKRLLGCAAVGLCVFGGAAVYSVTHATAQDSFGPHEATYSLNTTGRIVADFGPLGTAEHPSEGLLPPELALLHLGATISVGEIPSEVPVGPSSTSAISSLGNDVQSYVQFFDHPEVTIHNVTDELVRDAAEHTLLYGSEASAALLATYLLLGNGRRQELLRLVKKNRKKELAAIGFIGLGLSGCISGSASSYAATTAIEDSPIFNNTPLAGTLITGRLGEIINTYSGQVLEYIKKDKAYYGEITANMATVLDTYSIPGGRPEDYITTLVVSDLHCNTGMADAIHTAVKKTDANLYVDSGDTVMSGTSIEKYCVDTFSAAIPDGVTKIVAPGNHDSTLTAKQEKDDGFTVLDGKVIDVEGITILGDSDPYLNVIGQPVQHVTDETVDQLGRRLSDIACEQDRPVDLLIIHRPDAAQAALDAADTGLSGHMHLEKGPIFLNNGSIGYTSGTTGGASEDLPTLGAELGTESKMSVWLFDKNTKKATYMRTITTSIDGSVRLSPWTNLQTSMLLAK
jgi:predicted MPP superfamily phosphohydrolase